MDEKLKEEIKEVFKLFLKPNLTEENEKKAVSVLKKLAQMVNDPNSSVREIADNYSSIDNLAIQIGHSVSSDDIKSIQNFISLNHDQISKKIDSLSSLPDNLSKQNIKSLLSRELYLLNTSLNDILNIDHIRQILSQLKTDKDIYLIVEKLRKIFENNPSFIFRIDQTLFDEIIENLTSKESSTNALTFKTLEEKLNKAIYMCSDNEFEKTKVFFERLRTVLIMKINKKDTYELKKQISRVEDDLRNIKIEVITVIAIFSAIVFAFMGGLSLLGSAFNALARANEIEVLLMTSVVSFGLFNVIYGLLIVVFDIVYKNDEQLKENNKNKPKKNGKPLKHKGWIIFIEVVFVILIGIFGLISILQYFKVF